jgi:hypothetical protein
MRGDRPDPAPRCAVDPGILQPDESVQRTVELPLAMTRRCPFTCDDGCRAAPKSRKSDSPSPNGVRPHVPLWAEGRLSGEPGEGAGAVTGFEDELGLGLPDDAVHGDVLKDEVAQGLWAFDGYVEVEVVFAGDVEGLEDAGYAGQVGVELVDVLAVVAAEPDLDHGLDREAEGAEREPDLGAADDAAVAQGADPVGAGGFGESEPGGEGLVGQVGVTGQCAQDRQVGLVEAGPGGGLGFRQGETVETPANPTLDLADIAAVAAQADGVPVLVDNTFATPVLQNPAGRGATLVLHSATKYLGGHGDVVGGVVACADEATAAALRRVRAITGALLHPMGAYLLHRGLATLPLRVRRQQESARQIAGWLACHRLVEAVYYPGLDGDPRDLLGRQMRGPGAMVSVLLRGGFEQARRLTDGVRLFTHAVSLGGVDSLLQHPAALTHRPVAAEARPPQGLVRLSIGLEDADDLIADLDAALSHQQGRPVPQPRSPAGNTPPRHSLVS